MTSLAVFSVFAFLCHKKICHLSFVFCVDFPRIAVLITITAVVLMLNTTPLYAVSSVLERYLCQSFDDIVGLEQVHVVLDI